MIPAEELERRLERLQKALGEEGWGGILVVQRADLYYFSGTAQNGVLFIPAKGDPSLLVRKSFRRARQESGLKQVQPLEGWETLVELIRGSVPPGGRIGMELDVLPVNLFRRYRKLLADYPLEDASPLIRRLRAVKSPLEIEAIRRAARLSEAVFNHAREILAPGMTEIELAAQLEAFARARGHQGAIRMRGFNQELYFGHVMSGPSAAVPTFFDGPTGGTGPNASYPLGAGFRPLGLNEPILLDLVTVVDGYMVDQTRVFALGRLPARLEKAYAAALEIKRALINEAGPGTPARRLYDLAVALAREAGLADYFMGSEEKVRFIGHGLGIELDELPVIAGGAETALEEGMVFALEPKFVFPGEGVVGVEDTFAVTAGGLEQLTRFSDDLNENTREV